MDDCVFKELKVILVSGYHPPQPIQPFSEIFPLKKRTFRRLITIT
jgi:hypothetical protein